MMKTCVIIGGGLGGLFCGALLAKNGIKVTVLEKNSIIGGGLQCFKREDAVFETGMHTIGGFTKSGNLHCLCNYLGILDDLKIKHLPEECIDEVVVLNNGDKYKIPSGKQNFIKILSEYFPHESQGINQYVNALYKLTEEVPLFYLKEDKPITAQRSEMFLWSVNDFIAHFIKDRTLQNLLAFLSPLYAGVRNHTPAYIHALINVLYINGSARFIGGGLHLAKSLKKVIEENGGEVRHNEEVISISIKDSRIENVETTGDKYVADSYISSICPTALLPLLPKGALGKLFEKRLEEIPVTTSAFSVFIKFKPSSFPFINQTIHVHDNIENVWTKNKVDSTLWPQSFILITPPDAINQQFASKMIVLCLMDYEEVKQWSDSVVGHRQQSYYEWKKKLESRILDKLGKLYPGIQEKIEMVESASPLTIRDYYHTKQGSIYGFRKDCEDIFLSQLSVYTKLHNLFLTGQNINLHGICGVPLTSILTAEAILGSNVILDQLNKNEI